MTQPGGNRIGGTIADYSSAVSNYLILSVVRARAHNGDPKMIALLADIEAEEASGRSRKFGRKRGGSSDDNEESDLESLPLLDQLYGAATGLLPAPVSPQEALEAVEESQDTEQGEEEQEAPDRALHLTVPETESPGIPVLQEESERVVREVQTYIEENRPEMYRQVTAQDIAEAIKTNTDADGNVHVEGVIEKVVSQLGGRGKAAIKSRNLAADIAREEAIKAEQKPAPPASEAQTPRRSFRI